MKSFATTEAAALTALKGVGPTVIKRLEEIGIHSLEQLATYDTETITEMVAGMLNTTCWKNSPQAKAAITRAIEYAREVGG